MDTVLVCEGLLVTWPDVIANDNCGIQNLTSDYEDSYVFPLGTTVVTYTALDNWGNISVDSFYVHVYPTPIITLSTASSEICLLNDFSATVVSPNQTNFYDWYFEGSLLFSGTEYSIVNANYDNIGLYEVQVESEYGCLNNASFYVNVVACDITIFEAFSPNNDGVNDFFEIENVEQFENTSVKIFNRWGSEVYESSNYQNDWDGRSMNSLDVGDGVLPEGTYYYVVVIGGNQNGELFGKVYKGALYIKN